MKIFRMGRSRAQSRCQSANKQTWMTCGWHETQKKQTWQNKDQTWTGVMQRAWSETHEINTERVLTLSQCHLLKFTSNVGLVRWIQILHRSTHIVTSVQIHPQTPHDTPWVRPSTTTSHDTPWECPVSTLRYPWDSMEAVRFRHALSMGL